MAALVEKVSPVTDVAEAVDEADIKRKTDENHQIQPDEKVKFSHYFVSDCHSC